MAYTPELSYRHSCTLRRIAWFLNLPMTKAMEVVFEEAIHLFDPNAICECCKDRTRCWECGFNQNNSGNTGISRDNLKEVIK